MKFKLSHLSVITAISVTSFTPASKAALIAYEDFNYVGGQSLSAITTNGGTGWSAAWEQVTGQSGFLTSGSGQSLYFDQSPDLVTDGSSHILVNSSRANDRTFTTGVDINPDSLYFTVLVRGYASAASTADLRFEFYSGASATDNMRANVGISDGTLFADGNTTGFAPTGSAQQASVFGDDTTYLLAMKRDNGSIFASLIPADGNLSTIAMEPTTWQVQDNAATGVELTSLRIASSGTGGIRVDELRIATDWNSAVNGIIAVPEPSSFALIGVASFMLCFLRRRKI